MVSLLKLAKITEDGVRFESPHDGTPMLLTPEASMSLQNSIASDIAMQLDDVVSVTSKDRARMEEACHRSVRWLDRCIAAHKCQDIQNLFCIVQGGLDLELRKWCCEEMVKRDTPGVAIGGLAGGEEKREFCKVVDICTSLLPADKPRYVMGVGYPEDFLVAIALGIDMFDCVWPTRTARFGNAITPYGTINLKNATFSHDFRTISGHPVPGISQSGFSSSESGKFAESTAVQSPSDKIFHCGCPACSGSLIRSEPDDQSRLEGAEQHKRTPPITRAFLHHLAGKETVGAHLLTMHNLSYIMNLTKRARDAIILDQFPKFLKEELKMRFPRSISADGKSSKDADNNLGEQMPEWIVGALKGVGVDLFAD
ncbi:MAG: hypothetical protein M1831_005181 [Alyxoria varia]|nr:MAG: hypothetical protein M1831_005181 [Alyxoria varia]